MAYTNKLSYQKGSQTQSIEVSKIISLDITIRTETRGLKNIVRLYI